MWLIGTQRPSPAQVKCASWYRNWLQKSVIKNIIIILLATQTTFVDNCCSKFHPHFLVLSSVQSCTFLPSSALYHSHIQFDLKYALVTLMTTVKVRSYLHSSHRWQCRCLTRPDSSTQSLCQGWCLRIYTWSYHKHTSFHTCSSYSFGSRRYL